ncbi:MAG: ferredoxin [Bacilli bacterium]|nr:ferredoxin [Bacilli bacterium]
MKAFVDKNTCIGCELCPSLCPDIFYMSSEGYAVAKDIEIPEDLIESAQSAAESCPTGSITVDEM